ncbi:MAG TPA: PAS domain S-box protein, partial [Allocoleopsis sp.]
MALHSQGMETFDQILSASPDLIFVQDQVGRCSYVNVATARALGVERHQLLGKMLQDWELPSEIAQLLTAQRDLVFSSGVSISGEIILSNFYPSPRNYEYIYSPIQDNTGSVAQVIFTARDITLRKQAEIALRESEEKYRSLFDAASDAILIADFATGQLLNVNWSTARQLGYPRPELLQLSMEDIETDFASPYDYHVRTKQLEVDGSAVFEALYRRKDGSTFPVEIHAQVIEYENKLVIQSFVRDITERKRAEAEIRQLATLHAKQQQERVIGRIAQQVHQSLELEQVLNTSVTEVRQFLQTDRVLIYRIDSSQVGRVVVESVSPGWKSVQTVHFKTVHSEDDCLTLDQIALDQIEACQQGTILAIEDIDNTNLAPDAVEFLHTLQVRASLVLPILQAQQLWGGLIIHHCQAPRVWQAIEIDLLKQLVVQIGI